MPNNMAKTFLLVISFAGGVLVAAEKKQVSNVRKVSDAVAVRSVDPQILFCQNPGKHTATVANKQEYKVIVQGPFLNPKEKADMWTIFIMTFPDQKVFCNNFIKAIHSVAWETIKDTDTLRVTFCDNNFCFLRI